MENTITSNAMSASLLSRDVYGVCFPQRDSLDVLHSEFAAAREQFFSGGRKTVKVGRSQVVKGFDGKLKGKLSRRGLYWKKTATGMAGERAIALEEVFEQKGGWVLVTRDFRNVIVSRAFFNKSHIWLKSEYYEPWDAACARVIFKPGDLGDTVERFDWDPVNKRYDSTLLYPVTYQPGTPEESLLTARFGQPQLLVATAQGQFGYCPQQEAKDRQQAREQIQEGTILLMPAWEVKDGEIAKPQKEEDEESAISFTTLEDYAQLPPAQEEASAAAAGEEAPEKEAPSVGEEAPEKEAPSPAGEETPEKEAPSPAGEEAPQEEAPSPAGEETPEKEAQSPTGEETPEKEAPSPTGEEVPQEEAPQEEALPQEDAAILQAARQAAQGQPQPGEVQPGEGTLVVQGKEAGRAAAYDGAYAQGKRQGFGSAYYQDGALRYAGFWNQGRKEGLGVSFRDGDHALHVARWTDGKPGEFVSLFDGQGNLRYSGYMKDGKKDGAGVSPAPQGEGLYVGKWKDGESLEVGSAFDREGNLLYYGQWKDGKRHGRGTAFDKTGAVVFDGEWKEDAYFNGVLYQKWGGEDPAGEPEGTDPDWDL